MTGDDRALRSTRAQSETLATILMVAIVVTTIGVTSVAVLDQSRTEAKVTTDVDVAVGNGSLTVEHGGGDPLPFGEVFVVVSNDTERWRYGITQTDVQNGDGDADFEPGERWRRSDLPWRPGDVVDVAVYENVSNSRLFQNRFGVSDTTDTDERGDTAIPRLVSASRVDDTTIEATLRDAESGLLKSSIDAGDFSVSSGTIDSVDTSDVTNGSTDEQTVTLQLGSEPTTGTVTVSIEGDAGGISDVAGNVLVSGSAQATGFVADDGPPAIDDVSATFENASDELTVTVSANETLDTGTLTVELTNESADWSSSLTAFTANGATAYEDRFAVDGTVEENYTATVTRAEDPAGNDGASGQTDTVFVDTRPPTVDVNATFDDASDELTVTVTADESLNESAIAVELWNESANVTTMDEFSENGSNSYEATYAVNATVEENYTANVTLADDLAGNDGASGQQDAVFVDTRAPRVVLEARDLSEIRFWFILPYLHAEYDASYTVDDARPDQAKFYFGQTDQPLEQSTADVSGGSRTFTDDRRLNGNREYELRVVVTDDAGNTACSVITDRADGNPTTAIDGSSC